jgi:homoserine kinase
VLGGAVVSWTEEGDESGSRCYQAVRLQVHPEIRAVAFVPAERSSTAHTRGLLPQIVPHSDAAFNLSRAALAVVALTERPDLLLPATEDRLHQAQRAPALPATTSLIARLRSGGIAAAVSGAGPTILALVTSPLPEELLEAAADEGFTVLVLPVADGVSVH